MTSENGTCVKRGINFARGCDGHTPLNYTRQICIADVD